MRAPSRVALWTANWSGLAAGLAMLVVMLVFGAVFRGGDLLYGARVFGALVTRTHSLDDVNPQVMATGVFAHLTGPCLFWSRLFGIIRGFDQSAVRLSRSLSTGLLVALIAQVLDVRLILPAIQRGTDGVNLWAQFVPEPLDWTVHAAFGLALGGVYFLLNRERA